MTLLCGVSGTGHTVHTSVCSTIATGDPRLPQVLLPLCDQPERYLRTVLRSCQDMVRTLSGQCVNVRVAMLQTSLDLVLNILSIIITIIATTITKLNTNRLAFSLSAV